jgi:capsular polysaccharide biosynthesis protein
MAGFVSRLAYRSRQVAEGSTQPVMLRDVSANHESLLFRAGRIFPESFGIGPRGASHWQRPSRFAGFLVRNYLLRRGADQFDSAVWVIDDMSPNNYYHWMIDCLARLLSAERVCPDGATLLLPRYYQRDAFIEFTLRAFPTIRLEWIELDRKVRVERLLWVPRVPAYDRLRPPTFAPDLLSEVASRVGEVAGRDGTRRRLYLSRARATQRRVVNEAQVVEVMREHDVETVHIDAAKPWDQIRAARSAELIVGVHGAALSNALFLPGDARLLELHYPLDENRSGFYDCFRPLCEAVGVDYSDLNCRCECAESAPVEVRHHADLVVDLDQLRDALRGDDRRVDAQPSR